jgi:hypothetical protein
MSGLVFQNILSQGFDAVNQTYEIQYKLLYLVREFLHELVLASKTQPKI